MITATRLDVDDLTVVVAGQGGDGSLTVITLLGKLLAERGFHLYQSRSVRSRIKGGTAAAAMRASIASRGCVADRVDLAVLFDDAAAGAVHSRLGPGSVVIVDSSFGPPPAGAFRAEVEVIPVPFGRLAVRELRRELFKNSLAFGIATRLLSIPDGEAERLLEARFHRLGGTAAAANVNAARRGFQIAAERGLGDGAGAWRLAAPAPVRRLVMTGNEAVAFGFMVAGGRFFAGYPITPATEILQWLEGRLPAVDGVVVQAEDELAAVNLALGAALTGTRAMTATSGPGVALMQEAVGHAGSAEIPLVVVDCQRAGPSTGMPTKPEQSDLQMLALGANGDFPRIVLAPSGPADAFLLTATAVNLSQELQCPVYVVLDQATAQNAETIDDLDLEEVTVAAGKRLGPDDSAPSPYRRYAITADGVSPWAVPGSADGVALVTGNEHDEWGHVSTDPANRVAMMDKRLRKLDLARPRLPAGEEFGDPSAPIGVLGTGMEAGVLREAASYLAESGVPVAGLIPRTLWPVALDTVRFLSYRRHTYIVEHNATGQLAGLLRHAGIPGDGLRSVLRYDGEAFGPRELAELIAARERP